ncbi:hypothetical protein J2X06_000360 [Lysobacter niastensis]|uniref:Uncharacterized protein n=1 Tax=Lysobacter niastensis TaxID=380629 RepID=A0ABU1W6H1_9GAMM|nr:hypothetical protein [Lysobacter niastensis]MDR7133176.1 hypothetical protein [Lysobacter niastensis]
MTPRRALGLLALAALLPGARSAVAAAGLYTAGSGTVRLLDYRYRALP